MNELHICIEQNSEIKVKKSDYHDKNRFQTTIQCSSSLTYRK